MYGNPQQGYMPDFKPDPQAISKPSSDTPSGDGFLLSEPSCKHDCQHAFDCNGSCQGHFSDAVADQLHNPFTCWDCE